jgi:hypothetical protein
MKINRSFKSSNNHFGHFQDRIRGRSLPHYLSPAAAVGTGTPTISGTLELCFHQSEIPEAGFGCYIAGLAQRYGNLSPSWFR